MHVVDAFEKKKKQSVLGIFLDISKAFDTINHTILLRNLNNYGVRGVSNWFESYLSNRSQIVEYAGVTSSNQVNISSSVPQGSILAPLLFIIYVSNFNNCLEFSSNISFADDTNVFIVDNQLQTLYEKGNQELKKNILNIETKNLKISSSVPLGSILAPLLFIIYVNDGGAVHRTNPDSLRVALFPSFPLEFCL